MLLKTRSLHYINAQDNLPKKNQHYTHKSIVSPVSISDAPIKTKQNNTVGFTHNVQVRIHKVLTRPSTSDQCAVFKNGGNDTKEVITYSHWELHRTKIISNYSASNKQAHQTPHHS
uniref:Uncharacterized protein n=1 Tax=Arundo donax TaxID=35708 RepID=A0A0A8YND3_ARUDO